MSFFIPWSSLWDCGSSSPECPLTLTLSPKGRGDQNPDSNSILQAPWSSRSSHKRAVRHSRLMVIVETSRVWAVS